MSLDLAKYDVVSAAEEGATLTLRDPVSDVPFEGSTITVLGTDSKLYRDAVKAKLNSRLNQKKSAKVDMDQEERKSIELLARMTVGWTGIARNGSEVDCTFENAVAVYREFPWIKEQVDEFVSDRSNFLRSA